MPFLSSDSAASRRRFSVVFCIGHIGYSFHHIRRVVGMINIKAGAQLPFVPGLCACCFSVIFFTALASIQSHRCHIQIYTNKIEILSIVGKPHPAKPYSARLPFCHSAVIRCPLPSDVGTVQSQSLSASRNSSFSISASALILTQRDETSVPGLNGN